MLNARTALSPRTPIVIHLHVHPKREHVVKPYAASSKRSYKCGKSICVVKKNKKKQLSTSFNHLKECLDSCEVALWISLHQPQGIPRFGSAVLISIAVKAADSTPTGTKPGWSSTSLCKKMVHRVPPEFRGPLRWNDWNLKWNLKLNQTTAVRASAEATLASQHSHGL